MTTRTNQPAGGVLLIAEMKEFASFPKATQRYLRRSLDIAFGRSDPIGTWARDEGEVASIRAQARFYKQLEHLRLQIPDDSGLDMIEPFLGMLDGCRLRSGPGSPDELRGFPFPLRATAGRQLTAVVAGRLLRCCSPAAPASRPSPHPAPVN